MLELKLNRVIVLNTNGTLHPYGPELEYEAYIMGEATTYIKLQTERCLCVCLCMCMWEGALSPANAVFSRLTHLTF